MILEQDLTNLDFHIKGGRVGAKRGGAKKQGDYDKEDESIRQCVLGKGKELKKNPKKAS